MFIVHLPAGYILTKTIQKKFNSQKYLWLGLLGSIFPDFDIIYFYLFDDRQNLHHSYWIHLPFYWLILFAISLLAVYLSKRKQLFAPVIFFYANIFFHLILDTIVGKVEWLFPLTDQSFWLFDIPAKYGWWVWNFIFHWTFLFEMAAIIWAAVLLAKSRKWSTRKKILLTIISAIILFFLPQAGFMIQKKDDIFFKPENLPNLEYAIVFGARVYDNGELSPITEERVQAAVVAYKIGAVEKLFISGTNSANREVERMAARAIELGVADKDIVRDNFGIDTSDTCRHFATLKIQLAVLISQKFHLPRAMLMCEKNGLFVIGFAANGLAPRRNVDIATLYIRGQRFTREAGLTWLYLLGIYDKISNGAEVIESKKEKPVLDIIKFTSGTYKASLEYESQPKYISEWKSAANETVINGAYFNEDFSPSGFLVVNKQRIGNRMFDQDKTGLIVIKNGAISIRDLKANPILEGEQFDHALQSYPFLIKNRQPVLSTDSGKKARRTAIGMDANNNLYVIVVDKKEVSLFELMSELEKTNVSFVSVMNLDGGPSSGMISDLEGEELLINSFARVPSVIKIKKTR